MQQHSEIKPGVTIEGKYKVERILGVGGMGMVVAAQHTILKQRVALKFILDKTSGDAIERFLREARATARLESPHVCRIMDAGKMQDGSPFIVMEMLQGTDLAHHLIAHGALPISEAIDYVLQVLDGLSEAHKNGIVHRDLKPGNLFLAKRQDGSTIVKLLDFGISKLHKSGGADNDPPETARTGETDLDDIEAVGPPSSPTNLTATGVAMGSPPYMSPEQLRSTKEVDARCDIWAMGTILYELLTGARTFPGAIPRVKDILEARYRPMCELRPDIPFELEQIVARCLRVDPNDRFTSVKDLATALRSYDSASATVPTPAAAPGPGVKRTVEPPNAEKVRDQQQSSSTLPIGSASAGAVVVAPNPPPHSRPTTPSSSRYVWFVAFALLLTLALAVIVKVRFTPSPSTPSTATTTVTTQAPPPSAPIASDPPAASTSPPPPSPPPPASITTPPPVASSSVAAPKSRPRLPPRTKPTTTTTSDVDLGRL